MGDSRKRQENFLLSKMHRQALRPTQARIQWILGALSSWVKRAGSEDEKVGN
jgi:hypothetical protein